MEKHQKQGKTYTTPLNVYNANLKKNAHLTRNIEEYIVNIRMNKKE